MKQTPWFVLLDAFKRTLIADTIRRMGGNKTAAARFLGVERKYLRRAEKNTAA